MSFAEFCVKFEFIWLHYLAPTLEFFLIFLLVYTLLYFFRRTRAISVLWGVIVILLGLRILAGILKMEAFSWILQNLW